MIDTKLPHCRGPFSNLRHGKIILSFGIPTLGLFFFEVIALSQRPDQLACLLHS
jgi:hypothetical protein